MRDLGVPLRWLADDKAMWKGISCLVEYVAEDAALISYRRVNDNRLIFKIVSLTDLYLSFSNRN